MEVSATASSQPEVAKAANAESMITEPASNDTETVSKLETSVLDKEQDVAPTPLTQELQTSIVIEQVMIPNDPPSDCVTDFVHGLSPFISALEDFDGIGTSPASKDENMDNAAAHIMESTKIEEVKWTE